ncbi:MAG TPA: pitrilysin family protein [Candidatus Polarisedimenticolia bacterium]|nr:pitrilysin family protein [Candidatus Polarisedimenticolia bacterium]
MPDILKIAAALLVLILGTRAAAWGETPKGGTKVFPYPIHQTVLGNGLKVVVVPFDSPGLVAYWTVVRVGSRNEIEPGKSGFAHFFEHMMFRGTERYPKERFTAVLKGLGADHNAFTTDDFTAYHILGPTASLETIMTLESDRFMNLKYSVEDFKQEAGAVLGEYNKNASNPFQMLNERMRDAAFTAHTYKHTTIGFLRDVQDMPNQYEYSRQFFDRFYRPENCILLVVGDVDPAKVTPLARTYYGAWKKGTHRFEVAGEPPQAAEKRVAVDWPNPTLPYLYVAYHAPAFSTTLIDMPALDLVSQLLFSEAAPLYQKLVVEEQEVDLLTGGSADHRDPYLFDIIARVRKPGRVAYVEGAIGAALDDLKTKPVDAARLEQVKSHMKYGYAMGLDTADAVAASLAHYLNLTGNPEAVNQVYALYDRVTPEEVRSVARKYFVASGRTVVTLTHKSAAAEAAGGGKTSGGESR